MIKNLRWELKLLVFLALLWTVALSQLILFPIMLAFLLYLLLNPILNALIYIKMPRVLAAALIVFSLVSLVSYGLSSLISPAYHWIESTPRYFQLLEKKLTLKESLGKIYEATESVQNIGEKKGELKVKIVPQTSSITSSLFDLTSSVFILLMSMFVLLFFLLVYFKSFIQNLEMVIFNHRRNKSDSILLTLQAQVSRYMLTFSLIATCLGLVMTFALWSLDFPNPFLWGVMIMFLTFIPYLGHLIGITTIFFVSLVTNDTYVHIFLPVFIYFICISLEGQIITPMLLGARLNLNPFIVFLNMFFWGFIWGISGVFISVPLLVTFKILIQHIPSCKKYNRILEK